METHFQHSVAKTGEVTPKRIKMDKKHADHADFRVNCPFKGAPVPAVLDQPLFFWNQSKYSRS